MAQTKKKTATRTAKKCTATKKANCKKCQANKSDRTSNMFFVISMSVLATTLLFADLLMMGL